MGILFYLIDLHGYLWATIFITMAQKYNLISGILIPPFFLLSEIALAFGVFLYFHKNIKSIFLIMWRISLDFDGY